MKNDVPETTRREMMTFLAACGSQMLLPRLAGLGLAGFGLAGFGLAGCATNAATSATVNPPVLTNLQPVPPGTLSSSTVIVTPTVLAPITQGYVGLSYEKSAISRRTLTTVSTGLVKLFLLLNTKSVLRVGANSVDSTVYNPTSPGSTVNLLANSDIDLFAAFVQKVNCSVIYGINLKGFLASPPTQTVANAVAEAVYVAKALGTSLQAFELGNEPDLYPGYSYSQYAALWDSVATAIIAAVPGVALSGPAIATTPDISTWTSPFSSAEKSRNLNLLTQHRYLASTGSDATLLTDVSSLQFMQTLQTLATSRGMAWRLSETGSFYSTPYSPTTGSVAQDFATALWVIDYLFAAVASGAQGVNLHSGNLIQNSAYVPLSDDENNTVTFVNAVFYGMLLVSLGGSGNLVSSTLSTTVAASSYSVIVDPTHYSTWIVNKDQTASQSLRVAISFPITVKSATIKILQGSALNGHTGTTLQGAIIGTDGSFTPSPDYTLSTTGTTVTCYVPYNSAVLIQTVLN